MTTDHSAGWNAVADRFMAIRSEIGTKLVRSWAKDGLPSSAAILDIGCGSGVPIAQALVEDGFSVWGVDASPSLIAAYRRHLPEMPAACEPAQYGTFFGRTFVGAISIGLVFLLDKVTSGSFLVTWRTCWNREEGSFSAPLARWANGGIH